MPIVEDQLHAIACRFDGHDARIGRRMDRRAVMTLELAFGASAGFTQRNVVKRDGCLFPMQLQCALCDVVIDALRWLHGRFRSVPAQSARL